MAKYLFLYRVKDSDDRDCCAYVEDNQPRFECDHYFGGVTLHGACYCGHTFADYADIETILTESEYQMLIDYDKALDELGYGIKRGDERYKRGMALGKDIEPIFAKLRSYEAKEFQKEIIESEIEYLEEEYGLDEDNVKEIFDVYYLDYRDRAIVGAVFSDSADLGYEAAWNLGYIKNNDSISERYFDYEKFGEDLVNYDENYLELSDGRCVLLMY